MPKLRRETDLAQVFRPIQPEIYYSIYSLDPDFRRKWLPSAMDPYLALEKLAAYQKTTRKLLKLHWAFIEGENDSPETVEKICQAVQSANLRVDINIVRYNPYNESYGTEPATETIEQNANLIRQLLPAATVKVVARVGNDIYASCGQFIPKTDGHEE